MTDLEALLAEIIAHPEEDTPRLAYADCLEERGEPGDAERAEFVRVQVELAPLDDLADSVHPMALLGSDGVRREALLARSHQLLDTPIHIPGRGSLQPRCLWAVGCLFGNWVFRCGFVGEVTCAAADWLRHGHAARRLHPITRVNLTTWYPEYRVDMTTGTPFVLTPYGDPLTDGAFLDGPRFGGRTYREASCDALAACYPGVAFTLPEPFRPVAAALEQITGRRA